MASSAYQQIASEIAARIARGDLKPGDRVPSTRQIAAEWEVAIATATKALTELQSRGVARVIPGVGTVVADIDRPETPAAVAPRRPRTPDPAAGMTARIVQAAIAIADERGLGALSMRHIAIDLGVPTMSLYRWIPSKDELMTRILDSLMGGEWPPPAKGWRPQLEYVARRQWAGYSEHPWLAQIVSLSRPAVAPNGMVHTDRALRALDGYPLSNTAKLFIVLTIFSHVKGAASVLEAEEQSQRDTGLDNEAWMKAHDEWFTPVIQSGRYPALARIDNSGDIDLDISELFEFGLKLLLDGIGKQLESLG
jgi:DNA-binding transcriptional regulator YhcF (GntR family)